jgi:hypothetical protein
VNPSFNVKNVHDHLAAWRFNQSNLRNVKMSESSMGQIAYKMNENFIKSSSLLSHCTSDHSCKTTRLLSQHLKKLRMREADVLTQQQRYILYTINKNFKGVAWNLSCMKPIRHTCKRELRTLHGDKQNSKLHAIFHGDPQTREPWD